jgi:hypothetical protein
MNNINKGKINDRIEVIAIIQIGAGLQNGAGIADSIPV